MDFSRPRSDWSCITQRQRIVVPIADHLADAPQHNLAGLGYSTPRETGKAKERPFLLQSFEPATKGQLRNVQSLRSARNSASAYDGPGVADTSEKALSLPARLLSPKQTRQPSSATATSRASKSDQPDPKTSMTHLDAASNRSSLAKPAMN